MASTESIEVNEPTVLVDAMKNEGRTEHKAGLRLNNIKFYCVNFDKENGTMYLKSAEGGGCVAMTS